MYGLDFSGSMIVLGIVGSIVLLPLVGDAICNLFSRER
jgi:hypothetical protein